jgi:small GTP-binding protein
MQCKYANESVLLHLWDTAGQEEYDRLRPLSYPRSDVILLCFSTISQVSFESVKSKWFPEVNHYIPGVPYILVGTKIDLRESNTADQHTGKVNPVTAEQAQALCKETNCIKYMEICSKDGRGIQEVLDEAINQVLIHRGIKVDGKYLLFFFFRKVG